MEPTPGPWRVKRSELNGLYPRVDFYILGASGWPVAEATTGVQAQRSEDPAERAKLEAVKEANARLIAAAPDLLAAVERLIHPMADDSDLEAGKAAVAKARGGA